MRTLALVGVIVFAAGVVPPAAIQDKGGEDETGPYQVVEKWPTDWAKPGYIWGSQPGVFAESPTRIFIAARGELKLPEKRGRGLIPRGRGLIPPGRDLPAFANRPARNA